MVVAAERIQKHPQPDQAVGERCQPDSLADVVAAHLGRLAGDQGQFLDHLGSDDAVLGHVAVLLKVEHGAQGRCAEDAVDRSGVEPDGVELALQLGDIVAVQHRHAVVEKAVAEAVAGIDHGAPGFPADETVGGEAPGLLERDHRRSGALTEDPRGIGSRREPQCVEPLLDVPDRLTGVTDPIERHGRNRRRSGPLWSRRRRVSSGRGGCYERKGASSVSILTLGMAPTIRFLGCPSWYTMRVGMLITS